MRHRTKAEVFSFNKNDNEAYDEDHESNQSVDAADLNFDEVYWIMFFTLYRRVPETSVKDILFYM